MEEYDTLIEWGLPTIIPGEQAVEVGLDTSNEICEDEPAAKRQPLLGREEIRRTRLPLRGGGFKFASAVDTGGAANLGGKALVPARAVIASFENNPGRLLDELPDHFLA